MKKRTEKTKSAATASRVSNPMLELAKLILEDEEYRQAWHANLVIAIFDAGEHITLRDAATAAALIMWRFFGVKPGKGGKR